MAAKLPSILLAAATLAALGSAALAAPAAPASLADGLLVAPPAALGLHSAPLESLTPERIAADYPDTTSVLVFKDERLVYERYFGAGGMGVLNDTRSATKTLTAFIVGQAIADGALRSADEPAFQWLGDLAPFAHDDAAKQAITIADLLTMSSALDCNDWDGKNVGNEENMYPLSAWTRWAVDLPVKRDYVRNQSGRGPFAYCTAGTLLLGQVVQRATRKPLDRYFDERLLRPLGIRERQWARSPSGEFMTGGGLRLRSRDLLKLGVLLTHDGNWRGVQLVPAAWVKRMKTVSNVVDDRQSYGMLTWQREYATHCGDVGAWAMGGNGGNAIVSLPLKNMVVVVTRRHYNQRGMHAQTQALIEKHVLAALPCTNAGA